MNRRRFVSLAGLTAAGAAAVPILRRRAPHRRSRPGGFHGRYFPNVPLVTHEYRAVRFYDDLVANRSVVINFMYARCQKRCTPLTANLVKVQKELGDDVGRRIFFYSITLTPETDTPAVLAEYASRHGVGPGWEFLTGAPDDVELLRKKLGFIDPDPIVDADRTEHSGMILYGEEAIERWSACPGLADPAWIAKSIRSVLG